LLVCVGVRYRSTCRDSITSPAIRDAITTALREGRAIQVTAPIDLARQKLLAACFWMPSVQTMVSRKSSITNAFVNAVIPSIPPTLEEIEQALAILQIDPSDMRCAYCGDTASEWDHLRPLVLNRRPTGFISEIANLVPSCGKCNQSKGNKPWRDWMLSGAKLSPTGRKLATVERIGRLEAYEKWRVPTKIDFESILGNEAWEKYWALCEKVNDDLRQHQQVADAMRVRIVDALKSL
jgi:hypothetical protein